MKREIDFMELGKQMGGITVGMAAAQAVDTKLSTSLPSALVRGGLFAGGGFIVAPMIAPKNDLVKNIGLGIGVFGIRLLAKHFKFDSYISGAEVTPSEYYQALPMSGVNDHLLEGPGAFDEAALLAGNEVMQEAEVEGIY